MYLPTTEFDHPETKPCAVDGALKSTYWLTDFFLPAQVRHPDTWNLPLVAGGSPRWGDPPDELRQHGPRPVSAGAQQSLHQEPWGREWHSLCLESVGLFWLVRSGVKDPVELCSFNHFLLAWWMGQMSTERPYTRSSSRTLRLWVTLLVLGVSWAVLIGQIWSKESCRAAFS